MALTIEQLTLELSPERIGFNAELNGQDGLGSGLEVSGTLPPALLPAQGRARSPGRSPETVVWDLRAAGADLDVARWLRIVANEAVPLTSGRGDVELQASLRRAQADGRTLELDLGPSTWERRGRCRQQLRAAGTAGRMGSGLRRLGGDAREASSSSAVARPRRQAPARYATRLPPDASPTFSVSADDLRLQDLWPLAPVSRQPGPAAGTPARAPAGPGPGPAVHRVAAGRPAAQLVGRGCVRRSGPRYAGTRLGGHRRHWPVRADQSGGQVELAARDGLAAPPEPVPADIRTSARPGSWAGSTRSVAWNSSVTTCASRPPMARAQSRFRVIFPPAGPVFVDISARASWRRRRRRR